MDDTCVLFTGLSYHEELLEEPGSGTDFRIRTGSNHFTDKNLKSNDVAIRMAEGNKIQLIAEIRSTDVLCSKLNLSSKINY